MGTPLFYLSEVSIFAMKIITSYTKNHKSYITKRSQKWICGEIISFICYFWRKRQKQAEKSISGRVQSSKLVRKVENRKFAINDRLWRQNDNMLQKKITFLLFFTKLTDQCTSKYNQSLLEVSSFPNIITLEIYQLIYRWVTYQPRRKWSKLCSFADVLVAFCSVGILRLWHEVLKATQYTKIVIWNYIMPRRPRMAGEVLGTFIPSRQHFIISFGKISSLF